MSARLVRSVLVLVVAAGLCARWWAQYTGKLPKTSVGSSVLWLALGPLVPVLSVRGAIAVIGPDTSDAIYRIWILILAGVNTTVSGIVFDAANCSPRQHAVISRLLLVVNLLNMFWVFSLFSPDLLYQLWHTDRSYLFNSVIFTEMCPHIGANILALGIAADAHLPLHLGILSAVAVDAYLFYYGVKVSYTPAIREVHRRKDGHPTIPDQTTYKELRKSVEVI